LFCTVVAPADDEVPAGGVAAERAEPDGSAPEPVAEDAEDVAPAADDALSARGVEGPPQALADAAAAATRAITLKTLVCFILSTRWLSTTDVRLSESLSESK
jgi:hypothetical protein